MRHIPVQAVTLLWLLTLPLSALAEAAQPTPMPKTFVHDFANVLSEDQKAQIQAKAQRLKDECQTEIAVVTIDSLEGEDSFDYSIRLARSWGIGSKDNDIRGLLILVAIKDHQTAFRTSRHIEGELPDSVTGEISRQMNAYFKKGDVGGGLSMGLDKITERLRAVEQPQSTAIEMSTSHPNIGWWYLPVVSLPALGFGYAILRYRRKKNRESAQTRQTNGGFRAWAESRDPSTIPKMKRKTASDTQPRPRTSANQRSSPPTSAPIDQRARNNDYSSSSSDSSSSGYDNSSSSNSDSGSSYSGGSDFGGGGSDSSW